ncbi:MAG: metal ABC transporter substrate-binding protein, partial [Lachnospiraceae bacterium]|nr:metal ABC transporter substrate-binding protein [Lachnospiraceae bacterium]
MKRKLVSVLLTGVLTAGLLVGCGGSGAASSDAGAKKDAAASTTAAASKEAGAASTEAAATKAPADAASAEADVEDGELQVITIAASPTPHAEILEEASTLLEEKGYELEVTEFEDYVQPNEVVESEEFNANYFQHITYLNNFNEEKGTHLVSAGKIHYEPFGIYPGAKEDLKEIADGDTIAVPNDTTNEARALLLLQDLKLIKLADGVGITATKNDIVENPHNLEIQELEAAQIPHA